MGSFVKNVTSLIILVIAISFAGLLMAKPAFAQSIPKPYAPEFTLKYIDNSYDVPPVPATTPTYSIDPYTGKQTILNPGSSIIPSHRVENKTIEISIKNQPFAPQFYYGTNTSLFYNIQVKGYYETNNWVEVYGSDTFGYAPGWNNNNTFTFYDYHVQSNSEYTILQIPSHYEDGSKVDFRIQAIIANVTEILIPNFLPDYGLRYHAPSDYTQKLAWISSYPSDWSNIQTLSIPDGALSISTSLNPTQLQTPTSSPTVPELPITVIFPLLAAIFLIACKLFQNAPVKLTLNCWS